MDISTENAAKGGVLALAMFGAGTALGYWLGKRRTPTIVPAAPVVQKMVVLDEQEVDFTKPTVLLTQEEYEDHKRILDGYVPAEGTVALNVEVIPTEPEPAPTPTNVFAVGEDWDMEAELAARDETKPYIIHRDEFYAEETGFSHTTLTYYAKDDTLADEANTPISDYRRVTGELSFGHGSGDPRTVYIRVHKFSTEYEILLDDGSFAEEILGLQEETRRPRNHLQHSMPRFSLDE